VLADLHTVPDGECTDEAGDDAERARHRTRRPLSFHTAFVSEEDFAEGILALANDGAKVIVDDVGYFDEPMFEDGVVADAIDQWSRAAWPISPPPEMRRGSPTRHRSALGPQRVGGSAPRL